MSSSRLFRIEYAFHGEQAATLLIVDDELLVRSPTRVIPAQRTEPEPFSEDAQDASTTNEAPT